IFYSENGNYTLINFLGTKHSLQLFSWNANNSLNIFKKLQKFSLFQKEFFNGKKLLAVVRSWWLVVVIKQE
ncbi:hypothetical protein BpHYR1_048995, partial [Brachionus plicatilis]